MLELNKIYHGDCLELMADITDHSVDLILADLPYAQGTTGLAWDKEEIDPVRLWQHYERIIKPKGAILLTATMPFGAKLIMQKPDWFKYDLIWRKGNTNSPGPAKYRPLPIHEHILVFAPPQKCKITYNPQMLDGFKTWWKTNIRAVNETTPMKNRGVKYGYKEFAFKQGDPEGKRYPVSVLETSKPNYPLHPTQKPVELFEWLIRTYSNPDEIVLDNCCGSGTTGVAAVNTGRNFICIEKDAEYFEISQKRIAETLAKPRLLTEEAC